MADNLKRVESYQYPSAHLGHLTDNQQKALDRFKEVCQEKGYYHPPGAAGADHPYASHDDETLLRFLRARKFNPQDAFKQLKDTEDWRKQNHIEELYDTIDIQEYEEARRLYPQWTGRRDRRGIPLYVFQVSHLDSKTVAKYTHMVSKNPTVAHKNSTIPSKLLTLFALYENLTRFVLPFCSAMKDRPHIETPVSQSSNIVDISGVGLRQFWNLKNHMQDASQLATAHYPETLDRIFIIGAPVFFPTVWGWIKRWFDPITVSKIFILSSSDMKSTLEKYIDPSNIPKKYGGQLDFQFGDMPVVEPAIVNSLDFSGCKGLPEQRGDKTLPIGPIKWREGRGKEMEAICVGRGDDGVIRDAAIARVHTDFQGMHGVTRGPPHNTPINWSLEKVVSTPGTETQPKEEGDLFFGADLVSGNDTSGETTPLPKEKDRRVVVVASNGTLPPPAIMDPEISAGGPTNTSATYPAKPVETNHDSLPVGASQPRTGTSETRFEQQERTHAEGTLKEDTPHVVDYGQGEKAAIVEPSTVGQSPKDAKANLPRPEEPEKPDVVEQVKQVAGQAYEGAAGVVSNAVGAVGSGGREEGDKVEEKEEKGGDKEVKRDEGGEGPEDGNVEEFLRRKYPSESASAEAATK